MQNRNGFTLVELLVVIVIIGVLAAILFPVLSVVKENGRQTACINNLKQLGQGIRLYTDQWDNHFPGVYTLPAGEDTDPSGNWAGVYNIHGKCNPSNGQIYPYLKSTGVYLCPSARGVRLPRINDEALPYPLSYAMNDMLGGYEARKNGNDARCVVRPSRVGLLVHEDRDTIDDGDFNWIGWTGSEGGRNNPSQLHNGGTCVLYCDLHAKWLKYEDVMRELSSGVWDPLRTTR